MSYQITPYSCLAVALAAQCHATPVAGAAWVALSLDLGTLDHLNAVLSRVLKDVGIGHRATASHLARSSTGKREKSEEWERKTGELHDVEFLCNGMDDSKPDSDENLISCLLREELYFGAVYMPVEYTHLLRSFQSLNPVV